MSGEPKTLTLTEAVMQLGWTGKALHFDPYAGAWLVLRESGQIGARGATWPEAVSDALGVPVVARDEAAELREENKRLRASVDDLLLAPNPLDDENMRLRAEAEELRAALRTLVADLEALMEESHLSLYDGDGALVDTSWGKVLQGGKDEYLSNWRDVKRLAGGENEK